MIKQSGCRNLPALNFKPNSKSNLHTIRNNYFEYYHSDSNGKWFQDLPKKATPKNKSKLKAKLKIEWRNDTTMFKNKPKSKFEPSATAYAKLNLNQ